MKTSGWAQGIHETSAVQLERIGALRTLDDGRKFRYSRSGAAQDVGKALEASAVTEANITAQNMPTVNAGAFTFAYTAGGNVTYRTNYFQNGYLTISEGTTGTGQCLRIEGNEAEDTGTALPITLAEAPYVTINTDALGTICASPYVYTITAATITNPVIGVCVVVAAAAEVYTWVQTRGHACALIAGTPAVGEFLIPNATDGSLGTSAMAKTSQNAGFVDSVAGANTKYYPVFLTID